MRTSSFVVQSEQYRVFRKEVNNYASINEYPHDLFLCCRYFRTRKYLKFCLNQLIVFNHVNNVASAKVKCCEGNGSRSFREIFCVLEFETTLSAPLLSNVNLGLTIVNTLLIGRQPMSGIGSSALRVV